MPIGLGYCGARFLRFCDKQASSASALLADCGRAPMRLMAGGDADRRQLRLPDLKLGLGGAQVDQCHLELVARKTGRALAKIGESALEVAHLALDRRGVER